MNEPDEQDEQIAVLLKQLLSLRKYSGVNVHKMKQAVDLLGALAVLGGFKPNNARAGIAYLEHRLKQMGDSNEVLAVRNALRLGDDDAPKLLGARREALADAVGCRSTDTIENWENDGFLQLAIMLNGDLSQGTSNVEPASKPLPRPDTKATVLSAERFSRYRGKFLVEASSTRKIRAEVDNLEIRTLKYRLPTDPEAVAIEAVFGCSIESSVLQPTGVLISEIRLSKPLQRGEIHKYATRYVVNTDKPCDSWLTYSAPPRTPIAEAILGVQFTGSPQPTAVVWQENRTSMQALGDLAAGEPLNIDSGGYVQHTFTNITPGLTQVIAWQWPDD